MIGQTKLTNHILHIIDNNRFPRFSIIVGDKGSGKKVISQWISDALGYTHYQADISVDSVREVIANAYKCTEPILYVFADADKMSLAAKNALLKVTEEPPTNAYFIMTLENIDNALDTIRSRGQVFYMDKYSQAEIDEYVRVCFDLTEQERRILVDVCETPGDVNVLVKQGVFSFYNFVSKVIDNVATVSGSNVFKIGNSIKFKDTDDDKYDLRMFLKAFDVVCVARISDDPVRYASGIKVTSNYLQELKITGINKSSLFDMWILDIRKVWM